MGPTSDKVKYYYTLRIVSQPDEPLKVDCAKWEEDGSAPVDIYHITPSRKSALGVCSCPAWSRCKHSKAVLSAQQDGKIDELWRWKWVEGKDEEGKKTLIAQAVGDIRPEAIDDLLS